MGTASCCSLPAAQYPTWPNTSPVSRSEGSWWGHTSGHEIFAVLTRVLSSPDVIATRLVNGKITLIHRRLWPALVRVADRFPGDRLAAVDEEHTALGAHRTTEIPFPEWVPVEDITAASLLTVDDALAQLPACLR